MRDIEKIIKQLRENAEIADQERAKADSLFLSIGDGAISTDQQGKISRVNQAALTLLGCKESDLLGKWYPRVLIAEDEDGNPIPTMLRPITRALLSGKSVADHLFFVKKDGTKLAAAVNVSPIILDGKPIGTIEVFRNIEHELEVDRMKSEFIAIASHQLRTPLTAIKLDSEMLRDGYFGDITDEQKEHLHMILYSIARMEELISTLLNITRIEAGRIAVKPRPVQLKKLVERMLKELQGEAKEKQIEVSLKCSDDLPVISTDALLVKETCANLITNAIKYTPPKGTIAVSLYPEEDDVVIRVSDSGYGIPKSEQERIFTKFYRGSNVRPMEAIGTGLGLYMIKGVVDNLAGNIWFDSQENKGTTFYVSLPKAGPPKKAGVTTIEPTLY